MGLLFIAEKPSVAAAIASNLKGGGQRKDGYYECGEHKVTFAFGHLTRLAEPDELDPKYKIWKDEDLPILNTNYKLLPQKDDKGLAEKQLEVIRKLIPQCSEIVLATDPDREGHLIGMWILKYLTANKPVRRLWLNANDDVNVRRALKSMRPNSDYNGLYDAGVTRALLDQLMGFNLSRAYTLAAQRGGSRVTISIGRVQTPVLAMVDRRCREIESFKPIPYWKPEITVQVKRGQFTARWVPDDRPGLDDEKRIVDKRVAEAILAKTQSALGQITLHKTEPKKQAPRRTYRLASLQKEAGNRWGFSPKKTLDLAQVLYDKHKLISYPRTPCDYLPESQHAEAPEILDRIKELYPAMATFVDQADPQRKSPMWNQKKVDEHPHHGIIPTRGKSVTFAQLTPDEQRIYDLVVRAYVAQFLPYYEYDKTLVEATFSQEVFRASGRKQTSLGWKTLYQSAEDQQEGEGEDKEEGDEQAFPPMQEGEPAKALNAVAMSVETEPPSYYTEASLIEDMENVHRVLARWAKQGDKMAANPDLIKRLKEVAGIGTDATRGDMIETLKARKFIALKGRKVLITVEGRKVISVCSPRVSSPILTAIFEQELLAITQGGRSANDFMAKQLEWITKLVDEVKGMSFEMPVTGFPCPKCGKGTLVKKQRTADKKFFWSCNGYPDCKSAYDDYRNKPAMNKDGSRKQLKTATKTARDKQPG